jgi:hypothetical protein
LGEEEANLDLLTSMPRKNCNGPISLIANADRSLVMMSCMRPWLQAKPTAVCMVNSDESDRLCLKPIEVAYSMNLVNHARGACRNP